MTGQKFVAFEDLEVLRKKDLSALQSQKRDFIACPLQATDCVIHVKLRGIRFTKADAAFLKYVGNI